MDQCCYWPDYITPPTNLRWASSGLGPSTYRPLNPCTAGIWAHPQLHHDPQLPSSLSTWRLKEALTTPPHDTTLFIFISPTSHSTTPLAVYHIHYAHTLRTYTYRGGNNGADQMQAISRAVEATLSLALTIPHTHTFLWLQPFNATHTLLTLKPHRDAYITYDTCAHLSTILT